MAQGESLEENQTLADKATPERSPVLDAILQLPREHKNLVYMYYYEGYSTDEIAWYLHCPPSTVRTRLARARKKLKDLLGGEFYDE